MVVDREGFAKWITRELRECPNIEIRLGECRDLMEAARDRPVLVATGPLTSSVLADQVSRLTGSELPLICLTAHSLFRRSSRARA